MAANRKNILVHLLVKRTAASLAAALAAFGLAVLPASAAKLQSIKVGVPGLSIGFAPYYLAQDEGFFRQNGLTATFVHLSDETLPAALVSNGIQATPLTGSITSGALAGFKVKSVGLLVAKLPWMLVAKKSIASMRELRGKTIITSPPKGAPNLLFLYLLHQYKVNPNDVKLLHIGSKAARHSLIEAGRADGIIDDVKSGLELEAKMPDLHTLIPASAMPDQLGSGLGTSDALIKKDPALVKAMLRALWRANAFMRAEPAKASAILAKRLKVSPAIARKATDAFVAVLSKHLVPSEAIFAGEARVRSLGSGKKLTVAEIRKTWDTRLAAEVEKQLAQK